MFKDRFHSACIRSEASLICVVAYTDHNPVKAGLVELSTAYEFGSAASYVGDRSPPWLDRRTVAAYIPGADPRTGQAPEDAYLRVFGKIDYEFVEEMIERRRHLEKGLSDPLDTFLSPDRLHRIDWLLEQSMQADGSTGARLLAKADTLRAVLEECSGLRDWERAAGTDDAIGWRTMLIGLLRLGCARNCRQIAAMLRISPATVVRETRRHIERLRQDRTYLGAADEVLTEAVRRTFDFLPPFTAIGPDGRPRDLISL
ncbi:MAG: hypothetical protein ABFS86_00920 [Planctomycetota bacterium]